MVTVTKDNLDEISRTFEEYAQYNHRDLEQIRRHVLKNLVIKLHAEAKAVAPTRGEIEAKVKSLGWAVRKKGTEKQWGKLALKSVPKMNMSRMKKGEREIEKAYRKQALMDMGRLANMQSYVINKRAARIGFMATAYALAARLLNFNVAAVPSQHAKAAVSDSSSFTVIEATAGGIRDVDSRTGFIAKAIRATVLDMQKYIYDRQLAGRKRLKR